MADKKRCVVTGLGLICGVGDNVKDCWDAVTLGHSGIDEVKSVDTSNCYAHKVQRLTRHRQSFLPKTMTVLPFSVFMPQTRLLKMQTLTRPKRTSVLFLAVV